MVLSFKSMSKKIRSHDSMILLALILAPIVLAGLAVYDHLKGKDYGGNR